MVAGGMLLAQTTTIPNFTVVSTTGQKFDLYQELNKIDGIRCPASQGTFYIFPNVKEVIERMNGIKNDVQFSEYLLEKGRIAVVPGSAFGASGYIRISFATSMDNLKEGVKRLKDCLKLMMW